MKGLLVMMLVTAGWMAADARAAKPIAEPAGEAAPIALPAETLAAFEDIARATEARLRGEPLSEVDVALAAGLDRLAASFGSIDRDEALVAALFLETNLVGGELVDRVSSEVPLDEIAPALDRLAEAKISAVRLRVHAGAEGPDNTCLLEWLACMVYCSTLETALQRALCGAGCNSDLFMCNYRHVRPIIQDLAPIIRRVSRIPLATP